MIKVVCNYLLPVNVYSRVELVNSIVATTVKRLPSKEPSPEIFKVVPSGSDTAVSGIVKPPIPDTSKTVGTPLAINNSFRIEPFATTGIVSVLVDTSPAALINVAVPM